MEVVGEGVWKLAFGLAELDQKLAQDIASEVVLLAFDLNESGTPEEVRCVIGGCSIFYRDLVGRMKILAEGKVVTILQIEAVLHSFGLDLLPVLSMTAPELGLVFCLLAGINPLLEKIVS